MTRRFAMSSLIVVLTFGAGACTSDESAPSIVNASDAAAPVVEQADVDEAAHAFVDALASEDLVTMREAQKAAADGSLAQAYMRHQANGAESDLDGGSPSAIAGEVTGGDADALKACYESEDGSEPMCYEYADFKVNEAGELADFSIDGKSLKGRLSVGNGKPTATPLASFVFDSAYITQSGALAVSGTIRTKGSPVFIDAGSNYRSRNGKVRAMSSSSGLSEFPANSRSTYTAFFDGPIKFGGQMNLTFFEDGGAYSEATATVRVK